MITPAYLIRILVRMGYAPNDDSCKRRLTDWRQKGILPPLKVKGCQHHGKIYYWEEPEIIAQAVIVCKLFGLYSRADWVMLSTWFVGYDIPLKRVRESWINGLEFEINHLKKHASPKEEMVDVLSRVIEGPMWRQKRKPSPLLQSEFYISLFTNTFYNSDFDFDDLGDEKDIEKLILLLCPNESRNGEAIDDVIDVKAITKFLNEHFSLMARYELIKNCPDETLEQAHRNWREIKSTLRWFRKVVVSTPSDINHLEIKILLLIAKSFITMYLILTKLGFGSKIVGVLNVLNDFLPRISVEEMREMMQAPKTHTFDDRFKILRKRILSIWENTPMDKSMEFKLENHGQ